MVVLWRMLSEEDTICFQAIPVFVMRQQVTNFNICLLHLPIQHTSLNSVTFVYDTNKVNHKEETKDIGKYEISNINCIFTYNSFSNFTSFITF